MFLCTEWSTHTLDSDDCVEYAVQCLHIHVHVLYSLIKWGTKTERLCENWNLHNWRNSPPTLWHHSYWTIFIHRLGKETLNCVLIILLLAVLFWLQGFNDVFPLKLLHIFDERELEVSYIRVVVISQPGDVQGSASCDVYKTTTHSGSSKCVVSCWIVLVDFWDCSTKDGEFGTEMSSFLKIYPNE